MYLSQIFTVLLLTITIEEKAKLWSSFFFFFLLQTATLLTLINIGIKVLISVYWLIGFGLAISKPKFVGYIYLLLWVYLSVSNIVYSVLMFPIFEVFIRWRTVSYAQWWATVYKNNKSIASIIWWMMMMMMMIIGLRWLSSLCCNRDLFNHLCICIIFEVIMNNDVIT